MRQIKRISIIILILTISLAFYFFYQTKYETNLRQFYHVTKADPFLYDSSVEIAKLDNAVQKLSIVENHFRNTHQKYLKPGEIKIFGDDWKLFPIDFLNELSGTIQNTNKFLDNPNLWRAWRLISSYKKTVAAYRQNAESQLEAINNLLAEEDPFVLKKKIYFLGSVTSLEVVRNDFALIVKNANALEKEIDTREKCLYEGQCPDVIESTVDDTYSDTSNGPNPTLLSLELLSSGEKYDKVLGPYFLKSSCWGWQDKNGVLEPKTQAFYLFEKNRTIIPKLATEIFYVNYELAAPNWDTAQLFLEKGLPFGEQNATNDYRCSDLTYLPNLYSMAYHQTNLWSLPYLLERLTSTLEFLILDQNLLKASADNLYILTSRTDYSLLFLPYTRAVWRIKERPQFFLKENPRLISPAIETYTSLKEKGYSNQDIEKFHTNQKEILKSGLQTIE